MFITKKHISRRTVLRGMGVTVALPFLEAMVPAGRRSRQGGGRRRTSGSRAIEMVHGSAGATAMGLAKNLWSPAAVGRDFDLVADQPQPARAVSRLPDDRQQHRRPQRRGVHVAGNRRRSLPFERRVPDAGASEADEGLERARPARRSISSTRRRFGQDTPIPSMQLCIESVDQAGGCSYGYSCVYTDTISWASPNEPLPMIRDPRYAFDQLFGVGATPEERAARRVEDRSILDSITSAVARLRKNLGAADRARLSDYLDDVREIERRIQQVEAQNSSGEQRELPGAPIGVPDSFSEHVKLMFDLQALAFAVGHDARLLLQDGARRVQPRLSRKAASTAAFHNASHHGEREERIADFAKINTYHVSMIPYFLEKLKNTPDGDSNLLENTLVIYGSPMGNSNVHNHKRCPLFLAGHAGGMLKGNLHLKAPDGTPMANVLLTAAARPRRRRRREHRRQHGRARSDERVRADDQPRTRM